MAALILSGLAVTGLPKILPNQFSVAGDTTIVKEPVEIGLIAKDSPAQKAGLQIGDQILRVNGQEVPTTASLNAATEANRGQSIDVIYSRDGSEATTTIELRENNDDNQGYLGVGSGQREEIKATWSAPIVGVVTTTQLTAATFQGLGGLVANLVTGTIFQLSPNEATQQRADEDLAAVGNSVAGPVGILGTIFPQAQQAGPTQLLLLTAVISLSLAVMNVLPIPALDGGRFYTMTIFRLLKKKLTKEREERIQGIGFLILMALIIAVTFGDVSKLF